MTALIDTIPDVARPTLTVDSEELAAYLRRNVDRELSLIRSPGAWPASRNEKPVPTVFLSGEVHVADQCRNPAIGE